MRLLLIEDDTMIGESLCTGLRQSGYSVDWAETFEDAAASLHDHDYSLILLDLGLPDGSGIELLKKLRRTTDPVPTLIISARDTLKDVVSGLDQGADDYLIKPFALEELEARIRVLLRRSKGRAAPLLLAGDLQLDPAKHEVLVAGKPVVLSAREFALLYALLESPGAVLSRQHLENKLYGWNEEVESNAIEFHIHQLRKKIGREAISNVRGVGYVVGKKT